MPSRVPICLLYDISTSADSTNPTTQNSNINQLMHKSYRIIFARHKHSNHRSKQSKHQTHFINQKTHTSHGWKSTKHCTTSHPCSHAKITLKPKPQNPIQKCIFLTVIQPPKYHPIHKTYFNSNMIHIQQTLNPSRPLHTQPLNPSRLTIKLQCHKPIENPIYQMTRNNQAIYDHHSHFR